MHQNICIKMHVLIDPCLYLSPTSKTLLLIPLKLSYFIRIMIPHHPLQAKRLYLYYKIDAGFSLTLTAISHIESPYSYFDFK